MHASLLLLTLGLSYSAGFLLDRKVCYGDLGCFNTDAPFRSSARPITLLPQAPDVVQTTFRLFTRTHPNQASEQLLSTSNPADFKNSDFSASRKTIFLIHGFLDQGMHDPTKPYWRSMIYELLRNGDYNVVGVDWFGGNGLPYTQATANTRLVGAQLALLLLQLQKMSGLQLADAHLVGHSLGAHIAGYAGRRVPNIGRITGMDPAGPYFTDTDVNVRLDPTDAKFVDVIHTDTTSLLELGFGSPQEMGHADFYPNGGKSQPDCPHKYNKLGTSVLKLLTLDTQGVELAFSCSHVAAIRYFIDSINSPCQFSAYNCADWDTFQQGKCLSCTGASGCVRMGFHAQSTSRGKHFAATGGHAPYCRKHFAVTVRTPSTAALSSGALLASIHGDKAITKAQKIIEDDTRLPANTEFSKLITTAHDVGNPRNLILKFQKTSSWLTDWIYPDNVDFSHVEVFRGETQTRYRSCLRGVRTADHNSEESIALSAARCSA